MKFHLTLVYIVGLIGVLLSSLSAQVEKEGGVSILGTWQNIEDPSDFRVYQDSQLYQLNENGELLVLPVSGYDGGRIVVPDLGQGMRGGVTIAYTLKDDVLTIRRGTSVRNGVLSRGGQVILKRVADEMADVSLKPLPGVAQKNGTSLDEDAARLISQSLVSRMQRDQKSRSSGSYDGDAVKAQADDYLWLKKTITEHGWIDMKRFGQEAVQAAFLIAQHCVDMRLRLTAQAGFEKGIKNGHPVHGVYAWLYDRNRLFCRGNQRYATHYRRLTSGAIEILPLESVREVDAWRRKVRLSSFADLKKSLTHASGGKSTTIADSFQVGSGE